MSVLDRDGILALIPHQHGMCLWDEVLDWDRQRIRLRSHSHRDPTNPLRSDGQLRAVHLCEYGAQAMAVHGGLLAAETGGRAAAGMLVALRSVELHLARIDELADALLCDATVLAQSDTSQQYQFTIHHRDTPIAHGRAAVMLGTLPQP